MKRLLFPLLVCLVAPVVDAAVTGTVVTPDGTAVAGARVVAFRPLPPSEERKLAASATKRDDVASATTDAEGKFSLDTKAAGVLELLVERDGFAPASDYALSGSEEPLLVELTPAVKRTGRVTAAGKPVRGAAVVVTNGWSVLWSTVTAADGTYSVADPPAWAAEIVIVHPDYAPAVLEAESGKLDAALVAGGSVSGKVVRAGGNPAANARVTAGPWSETRSGEDGTFVLRHVAADVKKIEAFDGSAHGSAGRTETPLVVTLAEGNIINGTVRDSGNRPLAGVVVVASQLQAATPERWNPAAAVSDDKGNFRVEHLANGDYTVNGRDVAELDFPPARVSVRKGGKGSADLKARRRNILTGMVRDERKRPVAGAAVQFRVAEMPLLYARTGAAMGAVRTAADGTFRLPWPEELRVEEIRLQAFRHGYALGSSEPVTRDSRDVTITLPTGVELTGTVIDSDGAPVPGAGVIVLQDPVGPAPLPMDSALASGALSPVVETDAGGKFSLRVNETVHDVTIWKEGYAGARASSAHPGDPLQIVVDRAVEIRGRVVGKTGQPMSAGTVMASNGEIDFELAEVEADGTFVLSNLRPGTYQLQYDHESASAKKEVKAPASDVVLELPVTGTIAGRVIDAATRKVLRQYQVLAEIHDDMEVESVDGEDSFTMQLVPGPVELTVQAEGYLQATEEVRVHAEKTVEVTIELTAGRAASGTVKDENGQPVAKATLYIDDSAVMVQTEENGNFHIESLPREAVTINVSANGLVGKTVDLPPGDSDESIDVVLTRGRKAQGRVITHEGDPVEGAKVTALGDPQQEATTGADGRFTLSGLAGEEYVLRAKKDELESGYVRLGKDEVLLRMKPSAGAGTIHGTIEGFSDGDWMVGFVTAGDGDPISIERDGTFRIARIAAGEVEVRGHAVSESGGEATTPPVRVTVVPNGTVEVRLAFRDDVQVSGIVYEAGVPAPVRRVTFRSADAEWSATTGEDGSYTVTGIEPDMLYVVTVENGIRDYNTSHYVTGTSTFDIRIEWDEIEGRVLDEDGTPVEGAEIGVVTADGNPAGETESDAIGEFVLPAARGPHVITITKAGFATVTRRIEASAAELTIRMRRTDGLRVRISDARTGATLDGYAVAIDSANLQIAKSSELGEDGTMHLPLAPGAYRVAVSADGYASQSVRTTVPQQNELKFALTPGGTVVVRASRATNDLVKLILANGEEYVRCHCNGIAEIRLDGLITTIEHVAPGRYTMQVLDPRGAVRTSYPVTVAEGETVVAEVVVPSC